VKIALYSAIYGGYERCARPLPAQLGVPAYLYTDNPEIEAPGWEVRVVRHGIATTRGQPSITAPMLAHKWWKTHPALACPDVDISLWIDGSMELVYPDYVNRCLGALGKDDWSMVPHPHRTCIYPEAEVSETLWWRYDPPSIRAQADWYRDHVAHPPGWGLMATGANARRHTDQVLALSQQWWDECVNWSHQDQLSLPVLLRLWEGRVRYNYNMPWHLWWRLHHHGG
jgi:hypothetical protein